MLYFFKFFSSEIAYGCNQEVRVQFAHVQDATSSFADDIDYMEQSMTGLLSDLKAEYGTVEYGLVAFTDKPQISTGIGRNGGVWRDYDPGEGGLHDYCYNKVASLDENTKMDGIVIGGGKDWVENQLDAFSMSAIDPSMNWVSTDIDENGKHVVQISVLITDAPAHRNSEKDRSDENRNWYFEELMRGPCAYKDDTCTKDHGFGSSRTGTVLSLSGVLSHYNEFKVGNDVELLTHLEYTNWEHVQTLEEFKYCCTDMWNQWPYTYATDCNTFSSYKECAKLSCKRCSSGCDQYCTDDPDFEQDWVKLIDAPELNLSDYVYGSERFNEEVKCEEMEYPDPFSAEYAETFKKNSVTPVFFLRLPADAPTLGPDQWPFQFSDLYMSNNVCPIVGQRLARYWLCKSDPSRRTADGITSTGVCDDYDESELRLNTFYSECYMEHYGAIVESLRSYGVKAYISIVDAGVTEELFLLKLKEYVIMVIEEDPGCKIDTTTAEVTSTEPTTDTGTEESTDEDSTTSGSNESVVIGIAVAGSSSALAAGMALIGGMLPRRKSVELIEENVAIDNDAIDREVEAPISARMYL